MDDIGVVSTTCDQLVEEGVLVTRSHDGIVEYELTAEGKDQLKDIDPSKKRKYNNALQTCSIMKDREREYQLRMVRVHTFLQTESPHWVSIYRISDHLGTGIVEAHTVVYGLLADGVIKTCGPLIGVQDK